MRGSFGLGRGLVWHGYYRSDGSIVFEHGRATVVLELEHGAFAPWRIIAWDLRPDYSGSIVP